MVVISRGRDMYTYFMILLKYVTGIYGLCTIIPATEYIRSNV